MVITPRAQPRYVAEDGRSPWKKLNSEVTACQLLGSCRGSCRCLHLQQPVTSLWLPLPHPFGHVSHPLQEAEKSIHFYTPHCQNLGAILL